jgi:hypothetical protein
MTAGRKEARKNPEGRKQHETVVICQHTEDGNVRLAKPDVGDGVHHHSGG